MTHDNSITVLQDQDSIPNTEIFCRLHVSVTWNSLKPPIQRVLRPVGTETSFLRMMLGRK